MGTSTNGAKIDGATPSETINDLVHEAMLNYEQTLRSGLQFQENSVKLWRDLLAKAGSMEEIQARLDTLSADVFPNLRKQLGQFVESSALGLMLINRAGSQMLGLIGKTLDIYRASSIAEMQRRLQDVADGSLAAMRENVPAIVTAQSKLISLWKGLTEWKPATNRFANAQAFSPEHTA